VSWGGTNAAIFDTNTTTVRGGEGSRRWRLAEGRMTRFSALQYRQNTTTLRGGGANFLISVCACTVPILPLLPQYKEGQE